MTAQATSVTLPHNSPFTKFANLPKKIPMGTYSETKSVILKKGVLYLKEKILKLLNTVEIIKDKKLYSQNINS